MTLHTRLTAVVYALAAVAIGTPLIVAGAIGLALERTLRR